MLKSISLENYKAFENVTIPIRPLTILLGANSVGKSSITQMLMLLHQTAEERNDAYSSALKIYGNYVNIGAFENLFRDKDVNKMLGIRADIVKDSTFDFLSSSKASYIQEFKEISRLFPSTELWEKANKKLKNEDEFRDFVENLFSHIQKNKETDNNHIVSYIQYRLGIPDSFDESLINDIIRCYKVRTILEDLSFKDFFISFHFSVVNSLLEIKDFKLGTDSGLTIIELDIRTSSNVKVLSDLPITEQDKKSIIEYTNYSNTIFSLFRGKEKKQASFTAKFIIDIANKVLREIKGELEEYRLNYVSPLRAHPKRYYMLDKAKVTLSLDTLDGDAIAEVLKENNDVRKKVNGWFSNFGFKIDIKAIKEVVHHMNVTQNGLSLDITDVGFGISQVLPIIIQGFLSNENSITIIEQPEIHLHPKMQADLGDLFIDIVNNDNKKLIIETHSEYLLRRIRRRISERKIDSNDVAICLFHAREKDKPAWVEVLEIGEKGEFKWPEEFYGGELYNDTIEFLKNQV